MTTGILNSINTKDRMYKLLLKTDTLTERYMTLKARFKIYRETLKDFERKYLIFIEMT